MNPVFQTINIISNFLLLILLIFYFFYLRIREKAVNKKENKIDGDYHKIIDDALARERKIIGDTASEANQIISGAQYISDTIKTMVNESLEKMVKSIEQGTLTTSQEFIKYYLSALQQMAQQSLGSFQNVTKELEEELSTRSKQFQDSLIPSIEKEIEKYKQSQLQQLDQSIKKIIQKVSQEVLNKSISVEDHEKLVIDALEKAKSERVLE